MIFRTTYSLTLLILILVLIFGRLGFWQLERKSDKELLFERFENAPVLAIEEALATDRRFAHVTASGRYDASRHILLDNKIHKGRAGVHVLTPFFLDSGMVLLVNRGWLRLPPDRLNLPLVPTDGSLTSLSGRLNRLPTDGLRIGDADVLVKNKWPQLVTYLDPDKVSMALGTQLSPWLVQLDPADPGGFEGREWKAAEMGPATHGAYALQWFSLAGIAIVIWTVLGFRAAQIPENQSPGRNTENEGGESK